MAAKHKSFTTLQNAISIINESQHLLHILSITKHCLQPHNLIPYLSLPSSLKLPPLIESKRKKLEEIVMKLRLINVIIGQDIAEIDDIRQISILKQPYCRSLTAAKIYSLNAPLKLPGYTAEHAAAEEHEMNVRNSVEAPTLPDLPF